jgi:hypothetical protein
MTKAAEAAQAKLVKYETQVNAWVKELGELDETIFSSLLRAGEIFYDWKYRTEECWVTQGDFPHGDRGFYLYVASNVGKSKATVDMCISLNRNFCRLEAQTSIPREKLLQILSKLGTFDEVKMLTGAMSRTPDPKLGDLVQAVDDCSGDAELLSKTLRSVAGMKERTGTSTGGRTSAPRVLLEPDGLKIVGANAKFVKEACKKTGLTAFQVSDDRVVLRPERRPEPTPLPQEPSEPPVEAEVVEEPSEPEAKGSVSPKWSSIFRPWAVRVAEETGSTEVPGHLQFEAWLHDALEYYDTNILVEGPAVMDFLLEAAVQYNP